MANERPIQTSLGDQLGFFRSLKLIMSLSLVQFHQLMYVRIHKWLFVFNLSDMCVIVLSSPGTHSSLYLLINSASPRAPVLSRNHPQGKLESRKGFMVEKLGSMEQKKYQVIDPQNQGEPEMGCVPRGCLDCTPALSRSPTLPRWRRHKHAKPFQPQQPQGNSNTAMKNQVVPFEPKPLL